jgi:hypothetical protein
LSTVQAQASRSASAQPPTPLAPTEPR